MKVIFLDIDGPLNNSRCALVNGGFAKNLHELCVKVDPIFLKFLRDLNFNNGIRIVLISSWRNLYTIGEIQSNLLLPIYSCTEINSDLPRCSLIKKWLSAHNYVEKFVIVDDDKSLYNDNVLSQYLVSPSFHDGMLLQDMRNVLHHLEVDI